MSEYTPAEEFQPPSYRDLVDELEAVTQERDNALLRIEELERQIPDHRDYWGQWTKGGVHPNA